MFIQSYPRRGARQHDTKHWRPDGGDINRLVSRHDDRLKLNPNTHWETVGELSWKPQFQGNHELWKGPTGSSGNDNLTGSSVSEGQFGEIDNDQLSGAGGAGKLFGYDGNDTLDDNASLATMDGAPGGEDNELLFGGNDANR